MGKLYILNLWGRYLRAKYIVMVIIASLLVNLIVINPNIDSTASNDVQISKNINTELSYPDLENILSNTPTVFTENRGQLDNDEVRFYEQGGGLWFTDDGVWFDIQEESPKYELKSKRNIELINDKSLIEQISTQIYVIMQQFINANEIKPMGRNSTGYTSNFFYGNDSIGWYTGVPNYQEIYYNNLYNNIDLKYYSNKDGLKYDFIVKPGAKIQRIRLKYEGAEELKIDNQGNLIIKTKIKDILEYKPYIYQNYDGSGHQIKGRFKIYNNLEYGFEILEEYDKNEILIIDPQIDLGFSTYIGGSGYEYGYDIEVDLYGNIYLTGTTASGDFPTTPGVYDRQYNSGINDIFVLKLNPNGSKILYSTFVGGNSDEYGKSITIDSIGNTYVTGRTRSANFPKTSGAFDGSFNGGVEGDGYIFKLNSTGSLLTYSTYIGGKYSDYSFAITTDSMGNTYITGETASPDFPVTNDAYDKFQDGNWTDTYILKLNHNGSQVLYSTFIGGKSGEYGCGIELDSQGNIFLAGGTYSPDFPTTLGANDTNYNDEWDAFILKFNITLSNFTYSTYIGGTNDDMCTGLKIDKYGNAFITGYTESSDFPTTSDAYKINYNGGIYDTFVTKLNHNGSKLIISTFIGGSGPDYGYDIDLDSITNIIIIGYTESSNFPISPTAYDKSISGKEAFIFKLTNNGSKIIYSSFMGGSGADYGESIVIDILDNAYITGETWSNNFPITTGAYNTNYNGNGDLFVCKFLFNHTLKITSLSLIKDQNKTNLIYSKLGHYTFRINITDTASLIQLKTVRVTLDPIGSNVQLSWDRLSEKFLKILDPNNYVILESTSRSINNSYNKWTIDFNVIFNWTYPDENLNDIQVYATGSTVSPVWFNVTNLYRVENDLVFNGTLSVKGEDNRNINENDLIRGGEKLNWTGLKPVYEGTTDVYPPTDEFDVNIWNEAINSWSDSPTSGENFTIQANADSNTDLDGNIHIINLSGIPPKCDATNETFTIRIDGDNVTFSNQIPDKNIWQTTSNVEVRINITDIGGGFVNGSSVKYCFSTTNGTNWSEWIGFPKLKSGVSVNPQDVVFFPDGINNLVKWQAGDSVGNGPVESEEYRILVDTEDVIFSNGYPTEKNESPTENVEVGITISDTTSGVDISTVEYAISTNSGTSWTSWKHITELNSENNINVTLSLKFPNGTGNRIKWRASDVAGNGPIESKAYVIRVNTWVEKLSIPKVKLWNPSNGSVISSNTIELSWRLLNTDLLNVYYDIYLDTVYPPVKVNYSGITNTTIIIDNLSNGVTYYWTVIPKTEKINGSCESGVWSFTITIPIPKVNLISPENNSIINDFQPGLSWSVEYDGTEMLVYDVYFGTSEDPGLEFNKHPSTNCFIQERLTEAKTYYWKVVPLAGDYPGPVSETWSFTVNQEYLPHFELELFILPPVVELPPGDIKQVKAIVSNLGELEDSILLRIEVPTDSGVDANVDEPSIISVIPHAIAEFNIMVTTSLDAPNEEVILKVIASSRRAPEFGLIVEEKSELTVKIVSKEKTDEDNPWLSLSEFWIIFLIIIFILIVMIIVWMVLKQKKGSQETKEESTSDDAVTVKPETVPKGVISVGQAPPTTTSLQLPEATANVESQQQTQTILKVPTLASSTTPGLIPEPKQIPQVTQVPQLPSAQMETSETIEKSNEETTPESDQSIDLQQETGQSSQEKN